LSNLKKCVSVEYDNIGRVYVFEDGTKYHSVTTMLGATSDKSGLDRWRRRVGNVEALRVGKVATHMGEQFHLLGEHFLKGKLTQPSVNPISKHIFNNTTKRILEKHVTKVISVEEVLYTDRFKLAGRADSILEWDNELVVFDFKLLNNDDKKWLTDYWVQTTIYAHCWEEMYGILPKKLVLVIGNKKTFSSKYYVSNIKPYISKMHYRVTHFNALMEHGYGIN